MSGQERKIPGLLVTAPSSSSGKTVVTMVLLELLKRKGFRTATFKTGPDYIDPMYHRTVSSEAPHNLDSYLSDEDTVRILYERACEDHDIALVEGAMGYYDGLGGTSEKASTYEIACLLDLPAVLVITEKGTALTEAAIVKGMAMLREEGNMHPGQLPGAQEIFGKSAFRSRKNSGICAVLLNECSRQRYERTAPLIERETGIPVAGFLPKMQEARLPSRHLGLVLSDEIPDLLSRIRILADKAESTVDLDRLLSVAGGGSFVRTHAEKISGRLSGEKRPVIAVARDEAFSFIYEENLELLKKLGADIFFFSPLHDKEIPEEADALYLPGGYPELYAGNLSVQKSMLSSIRRAYEDGLPLIAECGGYMALCRSIEAGENEFPMAGIFPGHLRRTAGLVRFGYAEMTAEEDSLLFRKGETVRIHSFHHFDTEEESKGKAFSFKKAGQETVWQEGYAGKSFYAAFPHLYLPGFRKAAERFVKAAEERRAARVSTG